MRCMRHHRENLEHLRHKIEEAQNREQDIIVNQKNTQIT